jgi:hypothetical protein
MIGRGCKTFYTKMYQKIKQIEKNAQNFDFGSDTKWQTLTHNYEVPIQTQMKVSNLVISALSAELVLPPFSNINKFLFFRFIQLLMYLVHIILN